MDSNKILVEEHKKLIAKLIAQFRSKIMSAVFIKQEESIIYAKKTIIVNGSAPCRIVLRRNNSEVTSEVMPFSTNVEELKIENNSLVHAHFYSGRYYENIADAKEDFEKREY